MSLLFKLSKYTAVPILIEWLTVVDLVLLEVSCSVKDSRTYRSWMLEFHANLSNEVIPPCVSLFSGILPWASKLNFNISESLFVLNETTYDFYKGAEYLKPQFKSNVKRVILKQLTNWKALVRCISPVIELGNLTEFNFESGPPEIVVLVAKSSRRLRKCFISNYDCQENVVSILCRECPELTELSYEQSTITGNILYPIAVHARNLRYFSLSHDSPTYQRIWIVFGLHCRARLFTFKWLNTMMGSAIPISPLLSRIGGFVDTLVLPNRSSRYEIPANVYEFCPNITSLTLGSSFLETSAVIDLLRSLPQLTEFSASCDYGLLVQEYAYIAEYCQNMRKWGPVELGVGIPVFCMRCLSFLTLLTSLDLRKKYLTDDGVLHIVKQCHLLTELYLTGSSELSDKSVVPLAESCTLLKELDLDMRHESSFGGYFYPVRIGDASAKAISQYCRNLVVLNMMGCSITDYGVVVLSELPKLLHLLVGNPNFITQRVMDAVEGQNGTKKKKFEKYLMIKKYVK